MQKIYLCIMYCWKFYQVHTMFILKCQLYKKILTKKNIFNILKDGFESTVISNHLLSHSITTNLYIILQNYNLKFKFNEVLFVFRAVLICSGSRLRRLVGEADAHKILRGADTQGTRTTEG
jgi:hypothetical protein